MKKSLEETKTKTFENFDVNHYFHKKNNEGTGVESLYANLHGDTPKIKMKGDTVKQLFILEGSGKVVIDKEEFDAKPHDLFVIKPGSIYSCSGSMKLFETLFSASNQFDIIVIEEGKDSEE